MKEDFMGCIRNDLTSTFDDVYRWFDMNRDELYRHPADGSWNRAEILEHIALTNHFLLILIRKGAIKALEKANGENFRHLLEGYRIDWDRLELIGKPGTFRWDRPDHMEPTGHAALDEVKARLKVQESECLDLLDQLAEGQGVLYKTTMSVNNLGKLDVYHYLVFLVQHAKRHLIQLEKVAMI